MVTYFLIGCFKLLVVNESRYARMRKEGEEGTTGEMWSIYPSTLGMGY